MRTLAYSVLWWAENTFDYHAVLADLPVVRRWAWPFVSALMDRLYRPGLRILGTRWTT